MLRFTLIHEVLGTLQINAPSGWDQSKFNLDRPEEYHSLFETFEGEFIFYGDNGPVNGGLERILEAERLYGPDTTLMLLVEISANGYAWDTAFSGHLAIDGIRHMPNGQALVPVIPTDFTTIFKNRVKTPVNIQSATSLDNDPVDVIPAIDMTLTGQTIQKRTTYRGEFPPGDPTNPEFLIPDAGTAIDAEGPVDGFVKFSQAQVDLDVDEIEESFETIFDFVDLASDVPEAIELIDEAGPVAVVFGAVTLVVTLDSSLAMTSVESDPSSVTNIQIIAIVYLQKNSETPIFLTTANDTQPGPSNPALVGVEEPFTRTFELHILPGITSINTVPGDTLKVFIEWSFVFNIDVGADTGNIIWGDRDFIIYRYAPILVYTVQSIYKDTSAELFLQHDVAGQIMDRIINRDQTFYSERLGSTLTAYRQYDEDGCDWEYALVKGLQVRQYSLLEKPFFMSFEQWWQGIAPILNLGLGYEVIDGVEVIRVEEIEHFFDPEMIVFLDNVKIERQYDHNLIYKTVSIGYKVWQSEDIAGIDDPQTKHTYASILKKMGVDVTIESDFIAASLAIEATRRKTKVKSADYKFDNNTFIIALNVDAGSPPGFKPELDENFTSITGLLNAPTRYNSRMTPARMLERRLNTVAGGLYPYNSSNLKFTAGEGNYDMVSDLATAIPVCDEYYAPLSEKQDIPVGSDWIHIGQAYSITCPMTWEQYKEIRENRKNAVGISQTTEGHQPFYIKALSFDINRSTATLVAWPKDFFDIEVINYDPEEMVCEARTPVDPCLNVYLTEDNFEYETEAGDCLILN